MQFKNPILAEKYVILGQEDTKIIIGNYNGMLSDVSDPAIIEGMINRKSNLVAPKGSVAATNYQNMSKAALQTVAQEKGLTYDESATKADLIKLITDAETVS
jgi:hypothetical protein